ncbi:hypothetical protein, partial [Salmonella enterica]|uniref:hypothetical protein n=1 Tax=Salmonella enterica TaxID=28901 RepID=UPI003CF66F2D
MREQVRQRTKGLAQGQYQLTLLYSHPGDPCQLQYTWPDSGALQTGQDAGGRDVAAIVVAPCTWQGKAPLQAI